MIRVPWLVLVKTLFLASRWSSSHCILTWPLPCTHKRRERQNKFSDVTVYKDTNLIMSSPSWPHLKLIVSWRPHLQILSHLGLGIQYMNLCRTHKYLAHNTKLMCCEHPGLLEGLSLAAIFQGHFQTIFNVQFQITPTYGADPPMNQAKVVFSFISLL